MRLRAGVKTDRYTLFLSSSDEAAVRSLRDRVQTLLEDVIKPALQTGYPEARVALDLYRWEREAAVRAHGDSVNQKFVEEVRRSHLALVILLDELRDGTREELDAALDAGDVEVSLLAFAPSRDLEQGRREALEGELEKYGSMVLYNQLGSPRSDDAWRGLVRILVAFAFAALRASQLGDAEREVVERR
jgi:hypothetical protein